MSTDLAILRDLARQYATIAADPVQQERRELWADHMSLRPTRPLLAMVGGSWDAWVGEWLRHELRIQDPDLRAVEADLRWKILFHSFGSDDIAEPWISVGAVQALGWNNSWGVITGGHSTGHGGAAKFSEPIVTREDFAKLVPPRHQIDEAASQRRWTKIEDAVGDIITVDRHRGPFCIDFMGDISTLLGNLHGIERCMIDMGEDPELLQDLAAILRDGTLANQQQAEATGDHCLTGGQNQAQPYSRELPWPKANTPATPKQLWYHCAAQEFTGVSPKQHERFLLEYQLPIMARWGLVSYGCCEDLTRKITMLRRIPNLRMIGVAPLANLAKCCEQIGTEYVVSWRPNPTDTVCGTSFDERQVRDLVRGGLATARGTRHHILMKDIHTVHGEVSRLRRFFAIAREEAEASAV